MRHTQRMQMGLALGAIVLCLTSSVDLLTRSASTTSIAKSRQGTLSSLYPVDVKQISSITLQTDKPQQAKAISLGILTASHTISMRRVASSLLHAKLTTVSSASRDSQQPQCKVLSYSRDGHVLMALDVMSSGLLYDAAHQTFYDAGRTFDEWVSESLRRDLQHERAMGR